MSRSSGTLRAALSASCLAGAVLAPPSLAAASPSSSAWTVDKAASSISFRSAFSGMVVKGVFKRWDAQIQFDPKAPSTSKATVTVDLASASTGNADQDQALPTADWFNTARFPRATFMTRTVRDLGGGRYEAQGVLTIRGVSRPIVLPFTLALKGDQAQMNGQVAINRAQFGVGQGQFASADTVPLEVKVTVQVSARRAK